MDALISTDMHCFMFHLCPLFGLVLLSKQGNTCSHACCFPIHSITLLSFSSPGSRYRNGMPLGWDILCSNSVKRIMMIFCLFLSPSRSLSLHLCVYFSQVCTVTPLQMASVPAGREAVLGWWHCHVPSSSMVFATTPPVSAHLEYVCVCVLECGSVCMNLHS